MLQNWAYKKNSSLPPTFNVALTMMMQNVKFVGKKQYKCFIDQFFKSRWKSFIHMAGDFSNTLLGAQEQSSESLQDNSMLEPRKTSQDILTWVSFPHSFTWMVRMQSQSSLSLCLSFSQGKLQKYYFVLSSLHSLCFTLTHTSFLKN